MSDPFDRYSHADVRLLIEEYPLAWVSARGGAAELATLLPLIGEYDADGALTHIVGHLARRNPLCAALQDDPSAIILCRGPEAYISPAYAGLGDWGPTWNYAQLRIEANIHLNAEMTEESLDILVQVMEAGRPDPWRATQLGDRYSAMRSAIIGFRAPVTKLHGKFKLGQDERPEVLRSILATLPDPAMVRWIRRFNPGRA